MLTFWSLIFLRVRLETFLPGTHGGTPHQSTWHKQQNKLRRDIYIYAPSIVDRLGGDPVIQRDIHLRDGKDPFAFEQPYTRIENSQSVRGAARSPTRVTNIPETYRTVEIPNSFTTHCIFAETSCPVAAVAFSPQVGIVIGVIHNTPFVLWR